MADRDFGFAPGLVLVAVADAPDGAKVHKFNVNVRDLVAAALAKTPTDPKFAEEAK
jgi:hypothetical protein